MTESDKKKILAKIFCLKEETASYDKTQFNEFWRKVEDCEILGNDTKKLNKIDFTKSLKELQETFKKGNYDCLVLAVSSHGKEKDNGNDVGSFEIIWEHKETNYTYQINDLFELFDKTDDLQDKKKIFLLQMCRHRNVDTVTKDGKDLGVLHSTKDIGKDSCAVNQEHPSVKENKYSRSTPGTFPELHPPSDPIHESASEGSFLKETNVVWPKTWKLAQPCIENSIAFFSAPSGFLSYSRTNRLADGGGWLFVCMRKLIDDIKKQKMSVMDLFLMVNKEMSQVETTHGNVVLSSFNHMLTEDIFINIK